MVLQESIVLPIRILCCAIFSCVVSSYCCQVCYNPHLNANIYLIFENWPFFFYRRTSNGFFTVFSNIYSIHKICKFIWVHLTRLNFNLWLNWLSFRAQYLWESPSKAAVAHRIQERVDGRVQPQKPEGNLVPVVRHTFTATGGTDNHQ